MIPGRKAGCETPDIHHRRPLRPAHTALLSPGLPASIRSPRAVPPRGPVPSQPIPVASPPALHPLGSASVAVFPSAPPAWTTPPASVAGLRAVAPGSPRAGPWTAPWPSSLATPRRALPRVGARVDEAAPRSVEDHHLLIGIENYRDLGPAVDLPARTTASRRSLRRLPSTSVGHRTRWRPAVAGLAGARLGLMAQEGTLSSTAVQGRLGSSL